MASWLGPSAFTALARVPIPGQGTEVPQAAQCGKKKRQMSGSLFFVSDSGTHLPSAWVRAGPWVTVFGIRLGANFPELCWPQTEGGLGGAGPEVWEQVSSLSLTILV